MTDTDPPPLTPEADAAESPAKLEKEVWQKPELHRLELKYTFGMKLTGDENNCNSNNGMGILPGCS